MALRVGCCGLPVARERYFGSLSSVELDAPFYSPPRLETARRLRAQAPEGFEFSLRAWQLITHPSASPGYRRLGAAARRGYRIELCGFFRDNDEVARAWEETLETARALRARSILFQTPPSFRPGPDRLRDLYRFFRRARRERFLLAWEPRGSWSPALVARVCSDLGLLHAFDPLDPASDRVPETAAARYLRVLGRGGGGSFTDAELGRLREFARGKGTACVYFGNRAMWADARRFAELAAGGR